MPFGEPLQQLRLPYVLVAKPASPPTLMAAVAAAEAQGGSQQGPGDQGSGARRRTDTYRIGRQGPRARASPVRVTDVAVWEPAPGGHLR